MWADVSDSDSSADGAEDPLGEKAEVDALASALELLEARVTASPRAAFSRWASLSLIRSLNE